MKLRSLVTRLAITAFLLNGAWVCAQGTFQNLGFESAVLIPTGSEYEVQWMPAFPGWNVSIGGAVPFSAISNTVPLDSSSISIIDRFASSSAVPFAFPRVGNYYAILSAGFYGAGPGGPISANVELSQTGVVPPGTESLRFITQPGAANFSVSLNGSPLALYPLMTASNSALWGADLHGWANQNAELRFTSVAQDPYAGQIHYLFLDDIGFSPVAIPEPSIWALLGLGGTLFWFAARRRRK